MAPILAPAGGGRESPAQAGTSSTTMPGRACGKLEAQPGTHRSSQPEAGPAQPGARQDGM
ncbi:MAG TPA: hypothetical protein VII22_03280 [Streptosporangiaceae bacterium]